MTISAPSPVRSAPSALAAIIAVVVLVVVVTTVATTSAARAQPQSTDVRLRRFALMAGVNDGGPTRPKLRYASSDAQAMARVLESLGGVAPEDVVFVAEPTRASLLGGFDRLTRLLASSRAPGVRREVVVYYSGHSDEDGLLIGSDRLSYAELRTRIQAIPAEVRLAILDSCASGGFTRHKGGVRRAPFLMDASVDTKGHAYLTSSAVNEVAQESDRIGASFFTHYLVSGLRGAADVNRDRRVTLQEAFQFAAQETLARTEKTQGGPQHAAYEFDLVGTSDLIVTDVRSTQATLVLAPDLAGRISVREAGGNLVVELRKTGGHNIELGLEAGPYVVAMDAGAGATPFEAEVTLALGQRAELARLAFHPGRPPEVAVARGDGPAGVSGTSGASAGVSGTSAAGGAPVPPLVTTAGPPALQPRSFHLGIFPQAGDELLDVRGLSFGFPVDRIGRLSGGLQLSLIVNLIDRGLDGTQIAVGGNILRGPGYGSQIAATFNYAQESFHGAQLTSGVNVALGDLRGAQLAAGANVARAGGRGAQLAGGLNVADAWSGAQLAGGVNVARSSHGAQLAPVNIAGPVEGLQLGVVNVARQTSGAQLGVVNVDGQGRGFKLGIVNIAHQHDGEALGLINLIGDGIHSVAAYATDTMLTNVALKLGSRHLFTSFIFAYDPRGRLSPAPPGSSIVIGPPQSGARRIGFGLGVGYRQPLDLGRLRFVEVEASALNVQSGFDSSVAFGSSNGDAPLLSAARAVVGFHLVRSLTAIAGLSYNVAVAWSGRDLDIGSGFLERVDHSGATTIRQYPGLLLGLQI
jgi:hypothetical protein